jgi:NDP-sugar pyrophosphorylase family protein
LNVGAVPSKAVILAGGLGTRLAPYTTVFPKPLMPVGGRPILELVLRRLERQGVRRFVLAVSYLEELIRAFFGDGAKFGVELEYYREETPLGTAGVLASLNDLPDPCLVMNGDVLTTIDIRAMTAQHRERKAAMTVATQRRSVGIDYGVLNIRADSAIIGYDEKPTLQYVVSAGVNLVSSSARKFLRRGERCDIPTLVSRLIDAGELVLAYESDAYWRDIGRPSDYERANEEFPGIQSEFGV